MTARFPADESCDFAAVRALRAGGFDVVAVVKHSPRCVSKSSRVLHDSSTCASKKTDAAVIRPSFLVFAAAVDAR